MIIPVSVRREASSGEAEYDSLRVIHHDDVWYPRVPFVA